MKFWTIAYQPKGSLGQYPVYEGLNDGRYYLGGSPALLYPLVFSTKKAAVEAMKRVNEIERNQADGRVWVENGKFGVVRCWIEI